jgi:hypothetical protein
MAHASHSFGCMMRRCGHAPSALVRSGSRRRRAERSVTDALILRSVTDALIVRSEFRLTHLVSLVDGSRHGLEYPLTLPPLPPRFTRPIQRATTDNPQTFPLAPLPFTCRTPVLAPAQALSVQRVLGVLTPGHFRPSMGGPSPAHSCPRTRSRLSRLQLQGTHARALALIRTHVHAAQAAHLCYTVKRRAAPYSGAEDCNVPLGFSCPVLSCPVLS